MNNPIAETLALDASPQTTRLCDCELGHNGLGMMLRECDCEARRADAELAQLDREEAALRDEIDADELADAQDAGDRDRDGNVIPYPRYP